MTDQIHNNDEDILPEDLQVVEDFPRNSFSSSTHDNTLLVAKGKFYGSPADRSKAKAEHVAKLSNGIDRVISKHGDVKIRAVGDVAKSCASDAIAEATSRCKKNTGIELHWIIEKVIGNIGNLRSPNHVSNVKATVYRLVGFKQVEN